MFAQVIARINPTIARSTYNGFEYSRRKLPKTGGAGIQN
jgi:hypothetical protein